MSDEPICECGHARGDHNVIGSECITRDGAGWCPCSGFVAVVVAAAVEGEPQREQPEGLSQ